MDVTKKGLMILRATVDGVATKVELSGFYYAPKLAHNMISYGLLIARVCSLTKNQRKIGIDEEDNIAFYVDLKHNVLKARLESVTVQ